MAWNLKFFESSESSAHRLPLPEDELVLRNDALQRLRARNPSEVSGAPDAAEVPAEADALIWRPDEATLDSLVEPWDLEPFRNVVGERKFALDLPANRQRHAVQSVSEAGFVLQRLDVLDTEPRRVWLVAKRDDGYRVRLCREADEDAILRLFAPAFHVARSEAHWRWKYLENPWGRRWISLAVTDEEEVELAAHYAGYPVPFVRWRDANDPDEAEPEELLAVQIGDTMTAPEHRQVGLGWTSLLGRAVRHHFARFGREGVAFYYGFNSGKIRNFNLRFIQGRWAGSVGCYRRSLPLGRESRPGLTRAERLDLQRLPGSELDRFFQAVSRCYGMQIRRDSAWLRWRYGACPDEPPFFATALRYRGLLVAWGVFREHVDGSTGRVQLRWVDGLFHPEHSDAAGLLLAEALRQPEAVDAEEVMAWFSPRPQWWVDALVYLGFERVVEPDDLGLIYLPFDDARADETFLDVYYTWGDSDLT